MIHFNLIYHKGLSYMQNLKHTDHFAFIPIDQNRFIFAKTIPL